MQQIATTKMSSKGQVVIPDAIRSRLGLTAGESFIVISDENSIILKPIIPPDSANFKKLITKSRKQAKKVGLSKADVEKAIFAVRNEDCN